MTQNEPRIEEINDFLQRFSDVATERVQIETLRARVRNLLAICADKSRAIRRLAWSVVVLTALNVVMACAIARPDAFAAVLAIAGVRR